MSGTQAIGGLSQVAHRYDAVFCDIWGVLHNGKTGYLSASEALSLFREEGDSRGSCVVLLSNAPRPSSAVVGALDRFDINRNAYDAVLTSGDLSRELIERQSGNSVFHLGPERDLPIYEGLDTRLTDLATADYVVCTGLFDDETETADHYETILRTCKQRSMTMICANPDVAVERGGRLIPCAGAVAKAYAEIGGNVTYAGKPFREIYDAAQRLLHQQGEGRIVPRSRILAIGDSLSTDIAGARNSEIASLLVARGIHAAELGLGENSVDDVVDCDWLDRQPIKPDMIINSLVW